MLYPTRRYVALDTMGFELDNAGNTGQEQYLIQPFDGSVMFDPSTEKIKTYVGDFPNAIVTSSRDVSDSELYLNRVSKRAYIWNGTEMVEANLSVPDTTSLPPCDLDFSQDDAIYNITDVVTVNEGDPVSNLPESPWDGMVYYDTTQNQLIFRSGNTWSTTPPSN